MNDSAQPPLLHPDYKSTMLRAPKLPPVSILPTQTELTGPSDWSKLMGGPLADLTTQHKGAPHGQRIIVPGRVLDEDGASGTEQRRRNMAGQCRRPLHPLQGRLGRADRSQFHRRRPCHH